VRAWLTALALAVLPLVVYWPTISHEYGFRDDYALLREVRERPGWLMQLTSATGRPAYGLVLDASLREIHQVAELEILRVTSAVLIGLVGVLLWWQLRRSGWTEMQAAALAAAVTWLPASQIVVSWAIAWPIALALVAAVSGFLLVERGFARAGPVRLALVAAGAALYVAAGLTYQTSVLFVVMPFVAVLLLREGTTFRADAGWAIAHLCLVFGSLVVGFLAMNVVFAEGVVQEAARMNLEPHPFIKLLWFARNPVPNSLALFALRDSFATPAWFWFVVAAVVAMCVLGFIYGAKTAHARWRWLFAALLLPFFAHSASLAASSQAIGYRTMFPLTGLFLVLFAFGFRATVARFGVPRTAEAAVLVGFVTVGAVLARHYSLTLIAEPQGREWRLVQAAASRVPVGAETQMYVIRPSPDYRSTERIYADEHGSLSADAQWAAVEMFRAAMRQRFPDGLPEGMKYTLVTSMSPPLMTYDMVFDLRVLRTQGERAPAAAIASRR
jgi:hypothetical protein